MDFQWFDDLAAVQATSHFSLAAQKSHISQPALSRRIKALEDWAGFSLLDRCSRPVRLAPAGKQILDVALTSFKRLTDKRSILQQSNLMADQWNIGLTINLMHLSQKQDSQLDHIWQHLKTTASAKQSPLT